jgi:hypothetical protein
MTLDHRERCRWVDEVVRINEQINETATQRPE